MSKRSEEEYRALVENINDVAFSVDVEGHVTYVSPIVERFAFYKVSDVVGQNFMRFVHPDDRAGLWASFERTLTGSLEPYEFRLIAKDGAPIYVRTSSRPLWESGQLVGLTGIMTDITGRKRIEEELRQTQAELELRVEERTAELAGVNRILKILSGCNQTVMRATDETMLLQEVCRIIVDIGGYPSAWVGFAEHDAARSVRPVAQSGLGNGALDTANNTWADTDRGLGPTGTAIRTGKACVSRDIQSDPGFAPWREEANRRGYAAYIALPLRGDDGQVFGALSINAVQPDAFSAPEIDLLVELAGDLAYGVTSLRARTERRRAEEELFHSQQMLRLVLDTIPQRVFWKDRNLVYVGCNKPLALDTGHSEPNELIGKTDYETASAATADAYRADDRQVIETGQPKLNYEEPQIKPDGSLAWLNTSKVPLYDKDGQVIGVLGTYEDITERKRVERELQITRQQLADIIEFLPDATFVVDENKRVIAWNHAIEEMTGVLKGEIVGQGDYAYAVPFYGSRRPILIDLIGTEDPDIAAQYDTVEERHGILYAEVFVPRLYEGKGAYIGATASPLIGKDGHRYGGIESIHDITRRKQAEAGLRQHQRELESLLETSRDLSSVLDLHRLLSLIANRAVSLLQADDCTVFRLSDDGSTLNPSVSVGRFVAEMMAESLKVGEGITGYSVAHGQPVLVNEAQADPRSQHVAGTPADEPEHVMAAPLVFRDKTRGAMLVSRFARQPFAEQELGLLVGYAQQAAVAIENARLYDEVNRYANELELRVAQRTAELSQANEHLQALGRIKDEFVANVSHELRTPITSLKIYHQLLEGRPDRHESYLSTLGREIGRLEDLVEGLLILSRLDQGHMEFKPAQVDLKILVREYVVDRTLLAERKGLTLTLRAGSKLPAVQVDKKLIGQVLSILLTNALNYTPAGGRVAIRTRTLRREGRRWVGFSVSDTGPGIPPDEMSQIFARFYRGKVGRESGTPGTGLGLAIAREIVRRHQGKIEIDSEGAPGKGTTFTVWIPVEG